MLRVGLTGGYATGKSFVARELGRLGCHVLYADRLGHRVLEPGAEAYAPTIAVFGSHIQNLDGSIDRRKLAAIVFSSPDLLQTLNSFVHPAVFRLEEAALAELNARNPRGIAVIEAAILIETGRYRCFERLVLTTCDEELQIERGMSRDHLTREQVLTRLSRQMPLHEKKKFAHYLIDTDAPKEATLQQVNLIYRELKRLAEGAGV